MKFADYLEESLGRTIWHLSNGKTTLEYWRDSLGFWVEDGVIKGPKPVGNPPWGEETQKGSIPKDWLKERLKKRFGGEWTIKVIQGVETKKIKR